MGRHKSEDKRNAILAAATRVIASQGLNATTAIIAQEAGVSNGSLFTYFETKADLYNVLYLEIKGELAAAALKGLPAKADVRGQMFHVWKNWMEWAIAHPDQRKTLTQLNGYDELTAETKTAGHVTMAGIAHLLATARALGALKDVPMEFASSIMESLANSTMTFMVKEPENADRHCRTGFESFWRVVG
ncbi:MAG TPA: TetR/AcrR family transcriptional regulator [Drouetiella sp.]